MKIKKTIILAVAVTGFMGLSCPGIINAESIDNKIENAEKNINDLSNKKAQSDQTLAGIEASISDLTLQIDNVLAEKTKLEKEVNELTKEIAELEVIIEKRNFQIEEQARSAQVNQDDQNIVNVLLESDSVSDAIGRTVAYTKLVSANNDIMQAQKRDQEALAQKKVAVEQKAEEITKKAEELQQKQSELESTKKAQIALANDILKRLSNEKNKKAGFEAEKAEAERIAAAEAARLKEIEDARKAAAKELAAAQKAAAKAAEEKQVSGEGPVSISKESSDVGTSDNNQSTENNTVTEAPTSKPNNNGSSSNDTIITTPTSGGYQMPLAGGYTITSGFGSRPDPTGYAGTFHDGIDLAAGAGTPILAARAGKVVESSYHYSAGNHVIIQHDNGMYTYYMHMNAPGIAAGSSVSAGQVIGGVGTTGSSTGNHLHFGISSGLWSGFMDPSSVLSF